MSDEKFDSNFHGIGDNLDSKHVDRFNQENVVTLKSMREKVNWEIEENLREFLHQFDSVISDSKGQFLNLQDIFAREEIDRLLTVSATSEYADLQAYGAAKRFVEFVARSGYKDEPKVDEDGKPLLHRTTPLHDATRRLRFDLVRGLFDIYKRFDVNYTDHDGLTHFHGACVSGHVAVIEKFLEFGQDPDCLNVSLIVNPPLHLALQLGHRQAAESLLSNGANPNLVFKKSTSLHIACRGRRDDLAELLLNIGKEVDQVIHIDALDKKGRTPLHWALLNGKKQTTEALMRNGANTNLADAEGLTPLHYICRKGKGHNLLEMFFKINEELDKPVWVDIEDKKGRTPLHYALRNVSKKQIVRVLLRNAAKNSSLKLAYNQDRLTPLHIICLETNDDDVDLSKIFFEINDEFNKPWQVNAVDNDGNTPLHFALQNRRLDTKKTVELLLRRGIDPNSANAEGMTPLHFICQREEDDGFVEKFFKICDDIQKTVQVDAKDELNRSPLQLAVAHVLLNGVKFLLDRGADLSSFVYPAASYFVQAFYTYPLLDYLYQLRLMSGTLAIVELLEVKGYELDRDAPLTIIKVFANYKFYRKSEESEILDAFFGDDEFNDDVFNREAKKIIVKPSLSLDEVVELRPEEAEKLLTFEDYYKLSRSYEFLWLPQFYREACVEHLCEKLSRGVFRRWALDSFLELTRYRLPILCCETIIDESFRKEDLWRIYLANRNLSDAEKSDPLISVLLLGSNVRSRGGKIWPF